MPGNAALFEKMSQPWRAVGNTVADLPVPRFEPQTSRSKDGRISARPTGRYIDYIFRKLYELFLEYFLFRCEAFLSLNI